MITHAKANAGNVTPGDAPGYPVTISIPGRFKLASNLFVAANKIGIQVTAKNATIDLNGFTLEGSNVAWYGVTGGVDNVTIKNGTIDSFKFDGIVGTGGRWVVERVQVLDNGDTGSTLPPGIRIAFHDSTVAGNEDDVSGVCFASFRETSCPVTVPSELREAAPPCSETISSTIRTMGSPQASLEAASLTILSMPTMAAERQTR